jgi:hypothetical protein
MKEQDTSDDLVNDKFVARLLDKSDSWVRQERRRRKLGQRHSLTIDPVMVGPSPRYIRREVDELLRELKTARQAASTEVTETIAQPGSEPQ